MTIPKPYRPFRFPFYPGRIATIHRASATETKYLRAGRFSENSNHGNGTVLRYLLIIEEEQHRSRALCALLQSWGFITSTQTQYTIDRQRSEKRSYDLILFTGFLNDDICRRWRSDILANTMKTLIFSQSIEDHNRLNMILDGSQSIIPPDWEAETLKQRIFELTECDNGRHYDDDSTHSICHKYSFAGWSVDMYQHIVLKPNDDTIILTPAEFSLLRVFITYPRRVLTRNQILDFTTTMGSDLTDRSIDTQICRLRRRLMDAAGLIRTVRNEGYMFTEKVHRILSD